MSDRRGTTRGAAVPDDPHLDSALSAMSAFCPPRHPPSATGRARAFIPVASLVDTNVLVYRFDPRNPVKQRIAAELLCAGLASDRLRLTHQSLVEFVAAVTRPRQDLGGEPLLAPEDARREAEEWLAARNRVCCAHDRGR